MKHCKVAALVIIVALVALVGWAGWDRASGRTSWVDKGTPATCFVRDQNNDILPAGKVIIYDTTLRHYDEAIDSTTTNFAVNLGFWTMDSSGDFSPNSAVAAAFSTTNLQYNGGWSDVEWDIDVNGDLQPEP